MSTDPLLMDALRTVAGHLPISTVRQGSCIDCGNHPAHTCMLRPGRVQRARREAEHAARELLALLEYDDFVRAQSDRDAG